MTHDSTATATVAAAGDGQGPKTTDARFSAEHAPRISWVEHRPDVYRAMAALNRAASEGLEPDLLELVKIRASQINHCAFCLDMHVKDALAAGESVQRVVMLSAWEESRHFYTEREIAALELTEAVTVLTDGFVPDEVWERASAQFDEKELAGLVSAIVVINAWNRFGVTARSLPGNYRPGDHR